MYPVLTILAAHRFPGEEVMAMAEDVDVPVRHVAIDRTSARKERMGRR
jgi:hypothetical protein